MHSKVPIVMFRPHSREKSRKLSHITFLSDRNHTDAVNKEIQYPFQKEIDQICYLMPDIVEQKCLPKYVN